MRRRWYLLLAGLMVTAGLCTFAFQQVALTYEASGSVLLLPPKNALGTNQRGNPYLYLGGLGQAVEVLAARLNASDVMEPIAKAHPDATITAGQDRTTTGPIFLITVSSTTQADTMSALSQTIGAVPGALQAMQDQLTVPDGSRIGSLVLTQDTEPTVTSKNRDRAVIALGGVGVAGTVLLTGLVDGLLMGRRPRLPRLKDPAPGWVMGRTDPPKATKRTKGTPSEGKRGEGAPTADALAPVATEAATVAAEPYEAAESRAVDDDPRLASPAVAENASHS